MIDERTCCWHRAGRFFLSDPPVYRVECCRHGEHIREDHLPPGTAIFMHPHEVLHILRDFIAREIPRESKPVEPLAKRFTDAEILELVHAARLVADVAIVHSFLIDVLRDKLKPFEVLA
ncbi:MAG TPA: hypothetical protein VH022_14350 [Candidatus Acidoferrum sp.]|nr:hypothetical protein [Candidatus Acidoferrum sp.]